MLEHFPVSHTCETFTKIKALILNLSGKEWKAIISQCVIKIVAVKYGGRYFFIVSYLVLKGSNVETVHQIFVLTEYYW